MDVIVAAAVGAFAAILGNMIPSILRIRADRRTATDERREKRQLHLAALNERLLEADVRAVSDAVDAVVTNLRDIAQLGAVQQELRRLQAAGEATAEEVRRQEEDLVRQLQPRSTGLNHALVRGSRRAFSLDHELRSTFMRIDSVAGRLHRAMLGKATEDQDALWLEITEAGGSLQAALRTYMVTSVARALDVSGTPRT